MKLYYSPGACSLADHIALHEAGLAFEHERVDLKAKTTEHGADYKAVNPKGYVPALTLDSGETLTENVALLDWISEQSPSLRPQGPLGRTRQLEALAFLSSELHKAYGPLFRGQSDADKEAGRRAVAAKLKLAQALFRGEYLLGDQVSAADFYLFVMLLWAEKFGVETPDALVAFRDRLKERDSVKKAMAHEGLG